MKQFTTRGIVLARTNFGEADRIITFLTPDHGKVKAIAKAVRKQQSKLAGGIELFSISQLSFATGRGEINTLTGSRLDKHYGHIVKDLDRTNLAYELIKRMNKATEDAAEAAYFDLLNQALAALDDVRISPLLIELWFNMQLLRLAGHSPNLATDSADKKLSATANYNFDLEQMRFVRAGQGSYSANHIKFLRLGFGAHSPQALSRVMHPRDLVVTLTPLVQAMLQTHIRL